MEHRRYARNTLASRSGTGSADNHAASSPRRPVPPGPTSPRRPVNRSKISPRQLTPLEHRGQRAPSSSEARHRSPGPEGTDHSVAFLTTIGEGEAAIKPALQRHQTRTLREAFDEATEEVKQQREAERAIQRERAVHTFERAKTAANEHWHRSQFDECLGKLDIAVSLSRNDVLHRYRSRCHSRQGSDEHALMDAQSAVRLSPRGAANLYCLGRCLERSDNFVDSAKAYLNAMQFGQSAPEPDESREDKGRAPPELGGPYRDSPRGGVEARYSGLLSAVRRNREFAQLPRREPVKLHETFTARHTSVFDERKKLEGKFDRAEASRPEPPQPVIDKCSEFSAEVKWTEPHDGGDEIYQYTLQLSHHDVFWDAKGNDLFDGFLPWQTAHEGPARIQAHRLEGLHSGHDYKVRVQCRNSIGQSDWSEELHFCTAHDEVEARKVVEPVPKSWLRIELSDILLQHTSLVGGSGEQFLTDLGAALHPHVINLRRIFRMFCATGGGRNPNELSATQFTRFAETTGVLTGINPATGKKNGLKPTTSVLVHLVYQKAVAREVKSRTQAWHAAQAMMDGVDQNAVVDDVSKNVAEEFVDDFDDAGVMYRDKDDAGADGMGQREFVGGLVRLAWAGISASIDRRPSAVCAANGVGARLHALLQDAILPALDEELKKADPMAHVLDVRRVRAIIQYYNPSLSQIFRAYAAADKSIEAQTAQSSINLAELMFMCKEGRMIDSTLSGSRVSQIFYLVNMQSEQDAAAGLGGDDDESELTYDEFVQVIARICDAKIPEASRGGEPFEYTLQAWLQLYFIPTYKPILKAKARGMGKDM